jgi:arylformamidase
MPQFTQTDHRPTAGSVAHPMEARQPENISAMVDLSHTVFDGLLTYKGLPPPVITDYMSRTDSRKFYTDGTEFHIGRIDMVANTGTYLDSPFHRYEGGKDLSELPLEKLADLPGICIRPKRFPVDYDAFADSDVAGKAVLVDTGWSVHWLTNQYFEHAPFLTESAARFLMQNGAALVGIDSVNIDDMNDKRRPVHSILLQNDIPIVEHLTNLSRLPPQGFRFFAIPVKVKAFGTFPVRAFAIP